MITCACGQKVEWIYDGKWRLVNEDRSQHQHDMSKTTVGMFRQWLVAHPPKVS